MGPAISVQTVESEIEKLRELDAKQPEHGDSGTLAGRVLAACSLTHVLARRAWLGTFIGCNK